MMQIFYQSSLSQKYPNIIYASAGYDRDICEFEYCENNLKNQINSEYVVGVGETGLDYFHSDKNKKSTNRIILS